jgi:Tol biopolymer transport system component
MELLMKKAVVFVSGLIFLLSILVIVKCTRGNDEEDIEQAKIKRSREVRDSLTGEIIFYNKSLSPGVRKVLAKNGGTGTEIAPDALTSMSPEWSHDGSKISFIRLKSASPGQIASWFLTTVTREGTEQHEWYLGSSDQIEIKTLTWSPDGSGIAILCNYNKILYVETGTGAIEETQLTAGVGENYTSIAWWPKGNKIAISSTSGSYGNIGNSIWLFDSFDNNPQKETANLLVSWQLPGQTPMPASVRYMDWSPDGTMLAYSDEGGSEHIFIIDHDGTDNREIFLKDLYKDEEVRGFAPSWALNSKQIVFTGVTGMSGSTLIFGMFVTDINGSYLVDIGIPGELPDWH